MNDPRLIFVLLFVSGIPMGIESVCPSNYNQWNGACYSLRGLQTPSTFPDAEDSCELDGAHLASITSSDEMDYVVSLMAASSSPEASDSWMGLTKDGTGSWRWTDGSPVTFTDWGLLGQDQGAECARISKGLFGGYNCNRTDSVDCLDNIITKFVFH
ncbi:snaclec agkisacutacin subunit B-like [Diadema antillarum]|uniref:snaclec agkisacutacin subunit B-like n=1 Tax=Diadema antillarum TaxID=105358 RepID=UPI003A85DEC5